VGISVAHGAGDLERPVRPLAGGADVDNDVHRSYPPPAPEDRVDGDLDVALDTDTDTDLDVVRDTDLDVVRDTDLDVVRDSDLDDPHDLGHAGLGQRGGGARFRLAPPAPDQRVDLTRSYLPWVVLVTLLGLAGAVYLLL
jgi:hypothetical protein